MLAAVDHHGRDCSGRLFVLDLINLRARKRAIRESEITQWRCDGAQNFLFLFALLAALIAVRAGWREPLMILIALGSYFATPQRIREADNFSFAPSRKSAGSFSVFSER